MTQVSKATHSEQVVTVIQGAFEVSDNPDIIFTTILGSCVTVCLTDRDRKIGGMNHFLLPDGPARSPECVRYGANAMELLINSLLRHGADRARLEAKVFGGAKMIGSLRDIGGSNSTFALKFLEDEGIPCRAESLGGKQARRIRFWPTTGRVRQLLVEGHSDPIALPNHTPRQPEPLSDILLF